MRLAFRRSALLAAASLIVLGVALPALSQEAVLSPDPEGEGTGTIQTAPVQKIQPVPEADPLQTAPAQNIQPVPNADPLQIEDEVEGEDGAESETDEADEEGAAPSDPPIPAEWAPVPVDAQGHSAYAHYVAGRYALRMGESWTASDYYALAKALTPEQPLLREQVFSTALLSGNVARASASLPDEAMTSAFLAQSGNLTRAVQLLAEDRAKEANEWLKAHPVDVPHARAGLYLQAWVAGAAGDWERALAEPPGDLDIISLLLVRANRAQLLEKRRLYDQAEAEWKELTSHAVASRLFRLPYGNFLERRGRRDEALVQYQAAVTAGAADRFIHQAIARVQQKGRAPQASSWKLGASQALVTAADQAKAQDADLFGIVYQRLAYALTPADELVFQTGLTLRDAKQERQARHTFASISTANGPLYAAARMQMALSYQEAEEPEKALVELQGAAEVVPDDRSISYMLAAVLLQLKRFDEALDLLNSPLLNTETQGFEVRFLRGAAYSSLNRHAEAEAELWAALQLQPDNPAVLNHLGYLWVDQGERVEEGAEMIARAHKALPDDGNIQDSMGWSQFRRGLFKEAVGTLEQAVDKEPGNAEINDHLGDAYWAVGRQREAGFQWMRVLTLDVESERRAEVEAKLKDRLGLTPPASGTEVGLSGDAGN